MKLCRHCGAEIHYVRKAGGWLHVAPLSQLRVSRAEQQDVLYDPPRAGAELHRQTVLHPAQPKRALTAAEVEERINGTL